MRTGQTNDHQNWGNGGVRHWSEYQERGRGRVSDLSPEDQAKVEKLFEGGSVPPAKNTNHVFNYRITRQKDGRSQTIQVPESLVPAALVSRVKDTSK